MTPLPDQSGSVPAAVSDPVPETRGRATDAAWDPRQYAVFS
jgi:hypothetical protein